jgi:hypothetical protein
LVEGHVEESALATDGCIVDENVGTAELGLDRVPERGALKKHVLFSGAPNPETESRIAQLEARVLSLEELIA